MIDFVKTFKELVKIEKIHSDNNVFKLHYRITVMMLVIFSILLTSKQCFGDPIICDVEASRKELIDLFCWTQGTYVINKNMDYAILAGTGVDPQDDSEVTVQKYYQWVAISLCAQALLFYFPRYLWKSWEGGRLRLLLEDLTGPMIPTKWNRTYKEKVVKYILTEKQSHIIYFWRYTLCECLNLINVICQIVWLNWLVNGKFWMYGIEALTNMNRTRHLLSEAFPRLAKCAYFNYGPSGTLQKKDAYCILSLNILNEKIFLLLWFWLYSLLIADVFTVAYRAFFIFMPKFRMYLMRAQTRTLDERKARAILDEISSGGFFLLYKIGKNVNPIIYREICQILWLDWFINGKFYLYGIVTLQESSTNVMNKAFPKIAKCNYAKIGPSGTRMNTDALCLLTLNILNEKIFLVLWFWLYFLLIACTGTLAYRIFFISVSKFRLYLLRAQVRSLDWKRAKCVCDELSFGAFFFLYKIGKNVSPIVFSDIIAGIHDSILGNLSYEKFESNINV